MMEGITDALSTEVTLSIIIAVLVIGFGSLYAKLTQNNHNTSSSDQLPNPTPQAEIIAPSSIPSSTPLSTAQLNQAISSQPTPKQSRTANSTKSTNNSNTNNKGTMNSNNTVKELELELKQYTKRNNPGKYFEAHLALANVFCDQVDMDPRQQPAADLAVDHYLKILELDLASEVNNPNIFGSINLSLARMYRFKMGGKLAKNTLKSLSCSRAALRAFKTTGDMLFVARMHAQIALILIRNEYVGEGKPANQELAIRHRLAANLIYSKEHTPSTWAENQLDLALIYMNRMSGTKRGNFKLAITCFTKSLEAFTKHQDFKNWSDAHFFVALLYRDWPIATMSSTETRSSSDIAAEEKMQVEKCIYHCEHALQVFSETYEPGNYVALKMTLADMYGRRRMLTGRSDANVANETQ